MTNHAASNQIVYDSKFFSGHLETAIQSARVVVPIVLGQVQPASVVDVGCGLGAWLAVFKQLGVKRVVGIDGPHVDERSLVISPRDFHAIDLSRPFRTAERFDLAVCLEVAEHLPETSAQAFVESLVELGPAVLFSAAPPGQGGTNHVNEQWPSYWRAAFAKHNFAMLDCIRPKIWENLSVNWWYRQNVFLMVSRESLQSGKWAPELRSETTLRWLLVEERIFEANQSMRPTLRRLRGLLAASVSRRIQRLAGETFAPRSSRARVGRKL